jgi:hypothetical protein
MNEGGIETLVTIMNNILTNESVPMEWSDSTTVMIHKKGDPINAINYRPISLLNSSMKIFMQNITNRLTKWANKNEILPEEQAGFRVKRSCDEQISNINAAIQIGTRRKKKTFREPSPQFRTTVYGLSFIKLEFHQKLPESFSQSIIKQVPKFDWQRGLLVKSQLMKEYVLLPHFSLLCIYRISLKLFKHQESQG